MQRREKINLRNAIIVNEIVKEPPKKNYRQKCQTINWIITDIKITARRKEEKNETPHSHEETFERVKKLNLIDFVNGLQEEEKARRIKQQQHSQVTPSACFARL